MGLSAKTGASAKWPLGLSMPSPLAKTPEEESSMCFAELRDAEGYIMSRAPSGGQPGYPVPWRHPRLPELGTLLPEPVATTVILKTSTGGSEGTWTQHSVLRKEIRESDWAWVAQGW